jgi:oxygen-independent coproporphyrinogen-3 oxidase
MRRCLAGSDSGFVFKSAGSFVPTSIREGSLYIHIPFCKSRCPYCPYNTVPYEKALVRPYVEALLAEIDLYSRRLGPMNISSIYIGGGTPTNIVEELGTILQGIRDRNTVRGDVCIETTPRDIDGETVQKLVQSGIGLVSLGVQSFDDGLLQFIGRDYRADAARGAMGLLKSSGFKSVNVDLMFAMPGQTVEQAVGDVRAAIDSGADQITVYPLYTFPYTRAGRHMRLKQVRMPNITQRRRMYKAIHQLCQDSGLERVSVWAFKRGGVPRYSSVTRDVYIGLGAGAGSRLPGVFYFNTFSVSEYVKACVEGRSPIALKMDLAPEVSRYYWLYWRVYETYVSRKQISEVFGRRDRRIEGMLRLAGTLGLARVTDEQISLTERGAFWVHLAQNYFVLPYIDKMWSVAMREPWPSEVAL